MTAEQLDLQEREAFLVWRRSLSALDESNKLVTPFEKNLEVWRQLWRVVERSDLCVQIVDGTSPADPQPEIRCSSGLLIWRIM